MRLDGDLSETNAELAGVEARALVGWALDRAERPILTTSFGRFAAVLLDLVTDVAPDIPVVWIDHGFNTQETYRFARQLIERFELNMHIYAPQHSAAWITTSLGGVPDVSEPGHAEFTRKVKLEPFGRALAELQPDLWLTGIRAEETELRRQLPALSRDGRGVLKLAPLLRWREVEMERYLAQRGLPQEDHYFDPTKGLAGRECGLHQPAADATVGTASAA